jgi:outer membrane protein assembly factor BamA
LRFTQFYFFALLFFNWQVKLVCQESKFYPKLVFQENEKFLFGDIKLSHQEDSSSFTGKLNNTLYIQKQKGYVFASIDSVKRIEDTLVFYPHLGQRYTSRIKLDEDASLALSYKPSDDKAFDTLYVGKIQEYIVKVYGDQGYPFVKSAIDYIIEENNQITLKINVNKGSRIKWEKLSYNDSVKISNRFLQQVLEIKLQKPYQHSNFLKISDRIKNLNFLALKSQPTVEFNSVTADLILPLVSKNASRFDFIIGVLPNTINGRREWNINGEFYCDLVNKLGVGERLNITLKRLSLEDQFLKISSGLPFLLGTNFGVEGDLEIRRNRSFTLDVSANLGVQYYIDGRSKIKAYWGYTSSSLINVQESLLLSSGMLPKTLDVKVNGGGMELQFSTLDYIFNPTSGINAKINMGLGRREVVRNNQILALKSDRFDFTKAYDSIRLNNVNLNIESEINYFRPIQNWGVLKMSNSLGFRKNNDRLVDNELFRIGGNRLLRGFDELSILTNFYAVTTSELRLILAQNSFLSLPFVDFGYMASRTDGYIWTAGVGMGMNFETKAGVFNISFAAGNFDGSGFDFANTKIHFGYVSIF